MTLSEFLAARVADDEADAASLHELDCDLVRIVVDPGFGWTCSCGYPARVLAECKAKRRIVEDFGTATATLTALASVYADHPDFDEDWRP